MNIRYLITGQIVWADGHKTDVRYYTYDPSPLLPTIGALSLLIDSEIEINDDKYKVESRDFNRLGYWLRPIDKTGASSMNSRWFDDAAIEFFQNSGVLKVLSSSKKEPEHCFHDWERYTGAREVYDYCTRCDKKRDIDWKDLK